MSEEQEHRCVECDRQVEACACCESPLCGKPICSRDLAVLVKQSVFAPHTHGG